MKTFRGLFWINRMVFVLLHATSLECSLRERRKIFKPLSLDREEIELCETTMFQAHQPVIETYDLRQMSRVYVAFTYRVDMLHQQAQSCEQDFKKLCCEVEQYKQEYLSPLKRNALLCDGGQNSSENDFNMRLLSKLKQVANKHQFSQLFIPLPVPVLKKCESCIPDIDIATPYSEVWQYDVFGAWSPRSSSSTWSK